MPLRWVGTISIVQKDRLQHRWSGTVDSQLITGNLPFPCQNNERLNTAGYYKVSYEEKVREIDPVLRLILLPERLPKTVRPRSDHLHKVFARVHKCMHVNLLLWTCASVHIH